MRVRITEPGWDSYNGDIGGIQFESGESVEHLSRPDADRICSVMRAEILDGDFVPTNEAIQDRDRPAPEVNNLRARTEEEIKAAKQAKAAAAIGLPKKFWTRDELEALADEKGIGGLRDAAKPLGVKDRSISGIIKEILKTQQDMVSAWEQAGGKPFTWPGQETEPGADNKSAETGAGDDAEVKDAGVSPKDEK